MKKLLIIMCISANGFVADASIDEQIQRMKTVLQTAQLTEANKEPILSMFDRDKQLIKNPEIKEFKQVWYDELERAYQTAQATLSKIQLTSQFYQELMRAQSPKEQEQRRLLVNGLLLSRLVMTMQQVFPQSITPSQHLDIIIITTEVNEALVQAVRQSSEGFVAGLARVKDLRKTMLQKASAARRSWSDMLAQYKKRFLGSKKEESTEIIDSSIKIASESEKKPQEEFTTSATQSRSEESSLSAIAKVSQQVAEEPLQEEKQVFEEHRISRARQQMGTISSKPDKRMAHFSKIATTHHYDDEQDEQEELELYEKEEIESADNQQESNDTNDPVIEEFEDFESDFSTEEVFDLKQQEREHERRKAKELKKQQEEAQMAEQRWQEEQKRAHYKQQIKQKIEAIFPKWRIRKAQVAL